MKPGKHLERIFMHMSTECSLKLQAERKRRRKLHEMDCEKEAERIVQEVFFNNEKKD